MRFLSTAGSVYNQSGHCTGWIIIHLKFCPQDGMRNGFYRKPRQIMENLIFLDERLMLRGLIVNTLGGKVNLCGNIILDSKINYLKLIL